MSQLKNIPRLENKNQVENTFEWEIPNKVLASFVFVNQFNYFFAIKIKRNKKYCWQSDWRHFTKTGSNIKKVFFSGIKYLKKHGYSINENSVKFLDDKKPKIDSATKEEKNEEDINFFKQKVNNWKIIEENGGELPVKPINIGEILIDDKNKKIEIKIRQTSINCTKSDDAWYQVPYYGIGHLLCENCEYKRKETDINGAVFLLFEDKNKSDKIKIIANHNRQAIEILCDKVSVVDFNKQSFERNEFMDVEIGSKWGKFFSIKNI